MKASRFYHYKTKESSEKRKYKIMKKFKSPFKFQLPDRQILFDFWDMDIGYYLIINTNALNYFTPHPITTQSLKGGG